jgi:hypothetical protein
MVTNFFFCRLQIAFVINTVLIFALVTWHLVWSCGKLSPLS